MVHAADSMFVTLIAVVPNQVTCASSDPGVRCLSDPCEDAYCAANPGAVCVPNFCQTSRSFMGITVTGACTPVFVDPVSCKGVASCAVQVLP